MASPMAREGMRKDCRSHMVGKAQHCTAAKALYHLGILGHRVTQDISQSLVQPQMPSIWDLSVPSA